MKAIEVSKYQYIKTAWRQTFQCMKIPQFYAPFLIYALIQLFILIGFVLFNYFPFSKIFMPLQKALFGEPSLHYPNNFIILPNLFDIMNIALGGVVGILILGLATYYFFNYQHNKKNRSNKGALKIILQKFPDLFAFWIIETSLFLSVTYIATIAAVYYSNFKGLITFFRILTVMIIITAFSYCFVIILTQQVRFWQAILKSFQIFSKHFLPTLLIVTTPILLLQVPLGLVLSNTPQLVQNLAPEIVPILLGGDIILSMFLNFLVIGAITFYYKSAIMQRS